MQCEDTVSTLTEQDTQDIPACTSVAVSLVLLSNPLSPTQKYLVKSSSPVTLTEKTLRVTKLSSSCDCDVIVMSSPLSTSPTSIPFWNHNQVMVGGGIDLARHMNTAVSPTSTGSMDWGSSVMFTMAAVKECRKGTHKIADVFHITIVLTYMLAVRHHLYCYQTGYLRHRSIW